MKLKRIQLANFRRLEDIVIDFEERETLFVGPNNSGKTSATIAFRSFLERRPFKIHDFSVAQIKAIDSFVPEKNDVALPEITLDLWFSIDSSSIAFGRAFFLLPNVSKEFDEVGMRCTYKVRDAKKLWSKYRSTFPNQNGLNKKMLSHFLKLGNNLSRHFETRYSSLSKEDGSVSASSLEPSEGKRILRSLLRIDFVDAQRNMEDEEIARSNKLSSAFASFYRKNLDQPEVNEEAVQVIDENNDRLTKHYEKHFSGLMEVIKSLGVPSVNDRELRIVSSLSSEVALEGSTDLLYVDAGSEHELPEAYNGLGFKNLVYMAVRISHYHLQWMNTEADRPLCHLIFIEEPEVHLHAQVQQAFVTNMWDILNKAAENTSLVPQLVITTHSSHVLDTVDFAAVRYFQRCPMKGEKPEETETLNASKIQSLRGFKPDPTKIEDQEFDGTQNLDFLKKYLKLTHCDLFFADAAILVEGTVEKLLLPRMIEKIAPGLNSKYLSILEVGGAYSHRFDSLLKFLDIPYVVLTDIDSVDPTKNGSTCRADTPGAETSNASLKLFFGLKKISELVGCAPEKRAQADGNRFVSFQTPYTVSKNGDKMSMHGRTLEETFIYENLSLFSAGGLDLGAELPEKLDEVFEAVYQHVKSSSFKKTEFALNILSSTAEWRVPGYISDGLRWLDKRLSKSLNAQSKD